MVNAKLKQDIDDAQRKLTALGHGDIVSLLERIKKTLKEYEIAIDRIVD